MKDVYVPKVLIVDDIAKFRVMTQEMEGGGYNIIGQISFLGKFDNENYDMRQNKILLDNRIIDINTLKDMADRSEFDYIIFLNPVEQMTWIPYLSQFVLHPDRIISADFFFQNVKNNFHSLNNVNILYQILKNKNINSLLDIDLFFANNSVYVKPNFAASIVIEGIAAERDYVYPIFSNTFNKFYKSLIECRFRHYDAILLTDERIFENLALKILELMNMTENFIIFIRSPLNINDIMNAPTILKNFQSLEVIPCVNGKWILLKRNKSEDFAMYVVTHKKFSIPDMPKDYKIIHAGRKLNDDLGYIGDDSGQSISELNPYLNEMTAIYWIWKNTSHNYVGLSHYRRFFSNKDTYSNEILPENMITSQQAIELLQKYDILLVNPFSFICDWYSYSGSFDLSMTRISMAITEMMIERFQPEYLDTFYYHRNNRSLYRCHMLITRKYIFDSYCEWFFSFMLPAEKEFRKMMDIKPPNRAMGYISEHMLSVWLMKNDLRIKELNIMENLNL
ncbi:MAG: DUF4422 domain-containing protein [Selenomonadaceae bacterium]|nr:DUF4422 domain-containing protein [Selenomonadaceae bacterium]MBR1860067.1 DUF4422 domain-containing protein [Selenomonadaceae bacterium]